MIFIQNYCNLHTRFHATVRDGVRIKENEVDGLCKTLRTSEIINRNSQSKTERKETLCICMRSEEDWVKMNTNVDKKFQIEFICLKIWLSRGTLPPDQAAGSKLREVLL